MSTSAVFTRRGEIAPSATASTTMSGRVRSIAWMRVLISPLPLSPLYLGGRNRFLESYRDAAIEFRLASDSGRSPQPRKPGIRQARIEKDDATLDPKPLEALMRLIRLLVCVLLPVLAPPTIAGQPAPSAGSIVHELVHSPALEGNLLGDTADQPVAIYLPPGYADTSRRYPVLYLLHGIGGSPQDWVGPSYQGMEVRAVMDSLIASGALQPLVVVMPNGTNRYVGTFYMNSPVAGGWEDFVARDLVAHVDRTYRTLARRESRGV